TVAGAAAALQSSDADAVEALDLAAGATVHGAALVVSYKDVWLLSAPAVGEVERGGENPATLRRPGLLPYPRPDRAEAAEVVRRGLASHDRITGGDYARVTGLTQPGALKTLDRMTRDGLLERGEAHGRNAHYLLRPARQTRPPSALNSTSPFSIRAVLDPAKRRPSRSDRDPGAGTPSCRRRRPGETPPLPTLQLVGHTH